MLQIKNIYKSFGEQKVLQGLNMSIAKGKIYTMVGGNGTGKTTLFNLITGFLQPDKGEIWYNNKRLDNHSPVLVNLKGITRTFQDLRIINQLTVKENILISFKNNPGEKILNSILPARIFEKQYSDFSEKAEQILEKVHLTEVENNLAGEISYGQQKLLTIGCCLANNAQLLLIDEPVAGIDKDNYTRIYNLILELKREGRTILQIEHNHDFVESLSNEIWFLNAGKASPFKNFRFFLSDQTVKETFISTASGGTATLNMNTSQFSNLEATMPTDNIIRKFDKIISPIMLKILSNEYENKTLTQIRDSLLPRLMNGKITVN